MSKQVRWLYCIISACGLWLLARHFLEKSQKNMEKIWKKGFFPLFLSVSFSFSLMSKMSDCVIWMFCVLIYLWFAKMTIWKHVAGIVTDPRKKKSKTKKQNDMYLNWRKRLIMCSDLRLQSGRNKLKDELYFQDYTSNITGHGGSKTKQECAINAVGFFKPAPLSVLVLFVFTFTVSFSTDQNL